MVKKSKRSTGRQSRPNPSRGNPHRNGKPPGSGDNGPTQQPRDRIAATVKQTIAGVVELGYDVIDKQIRDGRDAAERLRAGLATSTQLNANINNLVEGLVATTRDVGATWLDLISIVLRSVGPQTPCPAPNRDFSVAGQASAIHTRTATITKTGSSGSARTISRITPADVTSPSVPPEIEVRGVGVREVTLDLRPPSADFAPFVEPLRAHGARAAELTGVRFELSADRTHAVLLVEIPPNQPAATYTGVILDSSSHKGGGWVHVVVGD